MTVAVYSFPESSRQAEAFANALGLRCHAIAVRSFPDGESLVQVPDVSKIAIVYRSLDNPDAKLVQLMLAASALRDGGASRVVLVAPYLAYMRQDMAFNPGEAVSQHVIGRFISAHFDGLVTVDPHLHRTPRLEEVAPGIKAVTVSAAETFVSILRGAAPSDILLVGPDVESRQWVESIASPLGLDILVGEKIRNGDRDVKLTIPGIDLARGRPVLLVDDVISSGATLLTCAALLYQAGARSIEAISTHCLASDEDLDRLKAGGVHPVRSTDTIPGVTATISMATALAEALRSSRLLVE